MSYLTKEIYERKAAYAKRRNKENMMIDTLTESQHYAIQEICAIRHDIHSMDCGKLLNPESSDYDNWKYIDTENYDNKLLEIISKNDLPEFSWSYDSIDVPTLYDLSEEAMEYGDSGTPEYDEKFDGLLCDHVIEVSDVIEKWNKSIESWLQGIDDTYGTSYCPTGLSRRF